MFNANFSISVCSSQEEQEMRANDESLQVKDVCATQYCLESCLSEVRGGSLNWVFAVGLMRYDAITRFGGFFFTLNAKTRLGGSRLEILPSTPSRIQVLHVKYITIALSLQSKRRVLLCRNVNCAIRVWTTKRGIFYERLIWNT